MTNTLKIYVLITILFLSSSPLEAGYQAILIPRISVTPEYSDNLFLSNENEVYDHITVISPGFTAQLLEKTRGMTLSYNMGYSCYDSHPQFNTLRHNSQFSGWINFTKHTRLDIQNAFMLTEESFTRLEETDEEVSEERAEKPERQQTGEKETVRRGREYHYTNDANLVFTHQFGESDVFAMKYAYGILENQDPAIEDRISHKPTVSVSYWPVPDQVGLEAGAAYARDEFSDTPEDQEYWEESLNPWAGVSYWFVPDRFGIESRMDYTKSEYQGKSDRLIHWDKIVTPSLEMTYQFIPYQLRFEAGLSHTMGTFSKSSDDFDKWTGSISLSKKITKKIELSVRYAHTIMDARKKGGDYTIYDPSVGISYTLDEGVPLSLNIGYFMRDRPGSEDDAAISLNGDIGKTWEIGRYGSVNFTTSSGYDEDYLGAEKLGFGIYYDAEFKGEYVLSKELSSDAFGFYKKNKYTDREDTRNDETREIGAGLTFQQKWFTVRVDYSYRTVNSTSSEDDYEENRIRWQVTLSPPRPIRLFQ